MADGFIIQVGDNKQEIFVTIFSNRKALHLYCKKKGLSSREGVGGLTTLSKNTAGDIKLSLFFSHEDFSAEVVSHEAVHAALLCMREFKEDVYPFTIRNEDDEEKLAYLVGEISGAVVEEYYLMGNHEE